MPSRWIIAVALAVAALTWLLLLRGRAASPLVAPSPQADGHTRLKLTLLPLTLSGRGISIPVYALSSVPSPILYVDKRNKVTLEIESRMPLDLAANGSMVHAATMHTHGLHISPAGVADNVERVILPGKSIEMDISLPRWHPSGTYLVHPHLHGRTGTQTGFMAASVLVVRDEEPFWRSLDEQVVMVQRVGVRSGHKETDAVMAFNYIHADGFAGDVTGPRPEVFLLVQGQPAPLLATCGRGPRRWRVANAGIDGLLFVRFQGTQCRVELIALDGVYLRRAVPWEAKSAPLVLPPGGRADFVVVVSSTQGLDCRLVSELLPADVSHELGKDTAVIEGELVRCARLDDSLPVRRLPALPRLPEPMRADLSRMPVDGSTRVFEWTKEAPGSYGVDHVAFSRVARFDVALGRVHEWTFVSRLQEAHPLHVHTNHFQVVRGWGASPEWRDTVFVPANGNVTIRFRPLDFKGVSLLHCHSLFHADEGMMVAFNLV